MNGDKIEFQYEQKLVILRISILTVLMLCCLGLVFSWIKQRPEPEIEITNPKIAKLVIPYRKYQNQNKNSNGPYDCDEPPRNRVRVTRKILTESFGLSPNLKKSNIMDRFKLDKTTGKYNWIRKVNGKAVDHGSFTKEEVMFIRDEKYNTYPAWLFIWVMRDWIDPKTVPNISLKEAQKLCRDSKKKHGTTYDPNEYYHYTKHFGTPE